MLTEFQAWRNYADMYAAKFADALQVYYAKKSGSYIGGSQDFSKAAIKHANRVAEKSQVVIDALKKWEEFTSLPSLPPSASPQGDECLPPS